MRLNWKLLRLAMLAFLTHWGVGCSGINAGGSISPASFFIPGVKADPLPGATPAPFAANAPSMPVAVAQ